MNNAELMEFYRGKRVFVTGHTGFKGAWLSKILTMAGAEVTGFAMPQKLQSLYGLLSLNINSVTGDIRDFDALKRAFDKAEPEIVFHLAAQSVVRNGYENPRETYETNVLGTVNILECLRLSGTVKSFLNVTTDKVYENDNIARAFSEDDALNGADPYSNSKSCSELLTQTYRNSFFQDTVTAVSTARAGNAIGGGDFTEYRIIPDCVRAAEKNEAVKIRNPLYIRPYQFVLEPLAAYTLIAKEQYEDKNVEGSYNIGPDESGYVSTGELAEMFCKKMDAPAPIAEPQKNAPREAEVLKIDCSKIKSRLGWKPKYTVSEAVSKTAEWTRAYFSGEDVNAVTEKQINEYLFA